MEEAFAWIGFFAALYLWGRWYLDLLRVRPLRYILALRVLMAMAPVACAMILLFVLERFAASDVRGDSYYTAIYAVAGIGWIAAAVFVFPYMGLDMRGDVLERNNSSAAFAIVGALLGATLCFAGGNIGDGPGAHAVIFSAGLSTLGFLGLWASLEFATRLSDCITIERDVSAGIRLGCWLGAIGLVLGRAVAGNWESVGHTILDFVMVGWFAVILLLLAFVAERFMFRRRSAREAAEETTSTSALTWASLFVGVLYFVAALAWVEQAGPW